MELLLESVEPPRDEILYHTPVAIQTMMHFVQYLPQMTSDSTTMFIFVAY